jgi:hypothetical protein
VDQFQTLELSKAVPDDIKEQLKHGWYRLIANWHLHVERGGSASDKDEMMRQSPIPPFSYFFLLVIGLSYSITTPIGIAIAAGTAFAYSRSRGYMPFPDVSPGCSP